MAGVFPDGSGLLQQDNAFLPQSSLQSCKAAILNDTPHNSVTQLLHYGKGIVMSTTSGLRANKC